MRVMNIAVASRVTVCIFAATVGISLLAAGLRSQNKTGQPQSPATPAQFAEMRSGLSPTVKPLVMGTRGIVAAGTPLVAEAGLRMLEKGGNAVDAGVASVFAAGVVEQMGFSLGGEVPILIKLAGQSPVAINGIGTAPRLATVSFFTNLPSTDPRRISRVSLGGQPGLVPSFGPLSAIVPGAVDALLLALKHYGTMSFGEVVRPAVELAEGFPVDRSLAMAVERGRSTYEQWPASRRFYEPGGHPPKVGEIFTERDLVATLKSMIAVEKEHATEGRTQAIEAVRDYFYRGPVAERISKFCEQAGCLLRSDDFAAYRAGIEQPLSTRYRGIEIYKAGFWTQGPAFLEALNLLEAFDLESMGHNSARYVNTIVEAIKLADADRDAYYGDPQFSQIPKQLISKEYARVRRPLINEGHASPDHVPGDPQHMQARASREFIEQRLKNRNSAHQDTTCVNVIDKAGNMFSATPSGAWVPALVAGDTGIPLSERAQSFVLTPGHPNQIAPRKRPRVTLTPTLALRDGKPWLAFSTPGGDNQDQSLLQVFFNIAEFGMDPQQAVEAPRFNSLAVYSSFDDHGDQPLELQIEGRFPRQTIWGLAALGHQILEVGDWSIGTYVTVIEFNSRTGVIRAGTDVRGGRYALAW